MEVISIFLLFIKPTVESNLKINEQMFSGKESINGNKFDVKSNDSREHYIIVVFKNKIGDNFIRNLRNYSKQMNINIKFDANVSINFAKLLLNLAMSPRVQIICNSDHSYNKTNSITD